MNKTDLIQTLEKELGFALNRLSNYEDVKSFKNSRSYFLNKKDVLEGLNLYGCKIKNLHFLANLKSLKYLDISYASIDDYNLQFDFPNLETLYFAANNLTDIDFLGNLPSLKELYLNNNKIKNFNDLKNLKKLEFLDASNNLIVDLDFISQLESLITLYLRGNNITNLDFLKGNNTLRSLDVGNNPIKDYTLLSELKIDSLYLGTNLIADPGFLKNFDHLISLDLTRTNFPDYNFLSEFKELIYLYLEGNNLENIDFLKNLKQLRGLYLRKNKIADIGVLENISGLKSLDLRENNVEDISPILHLIKKGVPVSENDYGTLILIDNPIKTPPIEIVQQGGDAILRYFEKIEDEGVDQIYEAKLTLVGEGSSGKTSLKERLIDENAALPREDTRTRGIKVTDWDFDSNNKARYIAHIWDFGGQDVYYPVHRFFLTENSVFVLLSSTRHTHHNFGYWIPTIFQFGGKSPIILGQTCHDGNKAAWSEIDIYLSNKNFNIIKTQSLPYYELNLTNNNEGLAAIKKVIIDQIENLPYFGKGVPKSWIPVRKAIKNEARKHPCISFEQFVDLCNNNEFSIFNSLAEIEDLAKFLHSLGILLWYYENEELKNWVILQPEWAMNAVYKIIDDPETQNRRGNILSSDFKRLWNDAAYVNRHSILKKMLQVFKIAFPKKHDANSYIIPARLLPMPKEMAWAQETPYLRLEYNFDFMPMGLVNQISSELSRFIASENDVWVNAVVLTDENQTSAQIIEDFYNRKIFIKAGGKEARGLIKIIMNAMKDVTDGYRGVTPKITVPCSCSHCINSNEPTLFTYEKLLKWSETKNIVTCNESGADISIDELLFKVGLEMAVSKRKNEDNVIVQKPLSSFISYSKSDGESNGQGINFLEEFKKHLAPLGGYNNLIKTWDDTFLLAGEDWDSRIKKELENCDIIFLLISKDFLNTKYIKENELKIALKRYERKECLIIPVILSACGWADISILSKLNALPRKGHNISSYKKNSQWQTQDDAWMEVYREIKKAIEDFKQAKKQ